MRIRVLGCSGGIGGANLRTTSLLVDNDILIDAGTGVGDLSIAELSRIDHVFVTHSHLDHIACLPLMVDTVGELRDTPLTVWTTGPTLEVLRRHIFNWSIWPDFTEIPSAEKPFMRFRELRIGDEIELGGRAIRVLPAQHTVPAVGYAVRSTGGTLAFSGDTTVCDEFWSAVNALPDLRYLIIETAFPDRDRQLAVMSRHLCPDMLASELQKLEHPAEIYITHLKPSQMIMTMREIAETLGALQPRMLRNNHVFDF
ncbi:MAG: 3',5'-cyclic-nucleotide phosphodiesterase [Methyloversatilis sp.]|uniref:MBL fold metallo-hydrolase n=1 Tax=Methyloversatilis sp. TaxID=2569862 RepID=UPI001A55D6F8|nr:3',5'-cyclic-nucleotide phosphodiesterase [Methyloversatilis sp.]MBL8474792.1 3',5'-cyclic-nucleotide phosphodiesterase [Methyloversatilis sp.]